MTPPIDPPHLDAADRTAIGESALAASALAVSSHAVASRSAPAEAIALPTGADTDIDEQEIHLFLLAGRLLLEHSQASAVVERSLYALATSLGREIRITIGYRDLTIFLRCGDHFEGRVSRFTPELKINMRMITEVHDVMRRLERRQTSLATAVGALEQLAEAPPRVNRWHAATMLAVAATSLAGIFGGDVACLITTAIAAALGVLLRQELARLRFNMFFLPFSAALLGALLGSVTILGGWTTTPDLCLLVPSLVLVPGVHMLNTAYDLFENHMPMALALAALSLSILGAIAFGLLLGSAATGYLLPVSGPASSISLPAAVSYAALAAAGFGVFFNVPPRLLWACVLCGVVTHAARYLGMGAGLDIAWATLLASALVGMLTSLMRARFHAPFAAIAFGAVVPLVPGALILGAASGTVQLVIAGASAPPPQLVETAVTGLHAILVLLAIAVGLLTPVALVRRVPRSTAESGRGSKLK